MQNSVINESSRYRKYTKNILPVVRNNLGCHTISTKVRTCNTGKTRTKGIAPICNTNERHCGDIAFVTESSSRSTARPQNVQDANVFELFFISLDILFIFSTYHFTINISSDRGIKLRKFYKQQLKVTKTLRKRTPF